MEPRREQQCGFQAGRWKARPLCQCPVAGVARIWALSNPVRVVAVICVEVGHPAPCRVRVACLHPQETPLCLAAASPGVSLTSLGSTGVDGKQPWGGCRSVLLLQDRDPEVSAQCSGDSWATPRAA